MIEAESTLREQLHPRRPRMGRGTQEGSKLLKRTGEREMLIRGLTEAQVERLSRAGAAAVSVIAPQGLSVQAVIHASIDLACEIAEQNPVAWRALAGFIVESAAGLSGPDGWAAINGQIVAGNAASAYAGELVNLTIPAAKIEKVAAGS